VLPAWVYSLGRVYSDRANISIPFTGLLVNLFATITPCLLGLLLAHFFPRVKAFCYKIAKPVTFIVLLSHLVMVFASKFYMVRLVRTINWLSGPLIPLFGYVIGGALAFILRLPARQCKTVAIETGIQNVGVAFLIIFTNLRSPEADFAALPLVTVSLMTNVPLFLAFFGLKLYERCCAARGDGKGRHAPLSAVAEMAAVGEEVDEHDQVVVVDESVDDKKLGEERTSRAPIYRKVEQESSATAN
jgi:predicted Na+-dependent transporter